MAETGASVKTQTASVVPNRKWRTSGAFRRDRDEVPMTASGAPPGGGGGGVNGCNRAGCRCLAHVVCFPPMIRFPASLGLRVAPDVPSAMTTRLQNRLHYGTPAENATGVRPQRSHIRHTRRAEIGLAGFKHIMAVWIKMLPATAPIPVWIAAACVRFPLRHAR